MARIPMIAVGSVIVATLGDEVDDQTALGMQQAIGERVVAERATGVLLDISALDIVDSFICKVLADTARMVTILGAAVAVVGMRPAVAITLVELGLPLAGIPTARDLDQGLSALGSGAGHFTTNGRKPRGYRP